MEGKISPSPCESWRAWSSTANAREASGTLCSRRVFDRSAGMVQTLDSRSTSRHSDSRTSPALHAVKTRNSKAALVPGQARLFRAVSVAAISTLSEYSILILSIDIHQVFMPLISLKLPEHLLTTSNECAADLQLSRAEYIRQAVERMNRYTRARLRADRLQAVSRRVRRESMRINAEFDALEGSVDG